MQILGAAAQKDEQVRSRRYAARIWVLKLLTEVGPPQQQW